MNKTNCPYQQYAMYKAYKRNSLRIVRERDSFKAGVSKAYLYENAETIEMIVDNRNTPDIVYIRFTLDGERYWVEQSTVDEKVWNTLVKLGNLKEE